MQKTSLYSLIASLLVFLSLSANAAGLANQPGWVAIKSTHTYAALVKRINMAAKSHKIGLVTRASATVGAARVLKKKIPGNMVVGLYHPRFAVPMLQASVAAGIEAPIRVYITENSDGTATLSYKKPSFVFAPYMKEGGEKLKGLAAELDTLFASLAKQAAGK
jgi:uncharacterized protein (DUF302 family)